jgi:hypothetical protein
MHVCTHKVISAIRPVCLSCRETVPELYKRFVVREVVDGEVVFHSNSFEIADDWARSAAKCATLYNVFQRFTVCKADEHDLRLRAVNSYQSSFDGDKSTGGRRNVDEFKRKERGR